MKASKKRGFTIVELIIVIAVIAILAAVLIPTFSNLISRANESVDIQAARNMNTFLATAKYTDGVNSILDVYDVFEGSGFKVENYSPLYKGRHYYYDIGYNQILYVDDGGTVLYPEEHKGEQKGTRNWCSLSMETITKKQPTGENYKEDENAKTITAKVSTPEEYAYVVDKYNNYVKNGKSSSLTLTLTNDLDFMGANCAIKEAKGPITIKGEGSNPVTIKNITSNVQLETDTVRNDQNIKADYYSGGLISWCNSSVLIENVVIENINVKTPTAGQVGVVIGVAQGASAKVTFKNVTIKNCSVIGHRDVGTLVGGAQQGATVTLEGNVNIENVKVKTTGGRSALVVGKLNGGSKIKSTADVKITNSTLEVYKMESLKQQFANTTDGWNPKSTSTIEGQTQYIYSLKATDGKQDYSAYGFRADALVLLEQKDAPYRVVTSVDNLNCSCTII